MGLLGLVKVAKGLVPSLLHVGAILTVVGGLFACCYNCRFYNAIGDARRSYKSVDHFTASSAVASGIFGLFSAVAAIAAVALSFTGLSNTIVTIVYASTVVLYIGEVIPGALLLKYGMRKASSLKSEGEVIGIRKVDIRKEMNWIYTDKDFWYFAAEAWKDQEKYMPEDEEKLALANTILENSPRLEGFESASSYFLLEGWQSVRFSVPCVFNFKESSYDWQDADNCDKIDIKTEKCVSTWSAGAVTRALKKVCNAGKEYEEEEKEETEWLEAWQKDGEGLAEAYGKEVEEKLEGFMEDGETTMKTFKSVAGLESYKDLANWWAESDKRALKKAEKYAREEMHHKGAYGFGIYLANQAIIAVQTVGVFFTLVGVALSFALSMLPAGGDDAAKTEA